MEIIILIGIIVVTYYLGKYALLEGQKIERQKKFKKKQYVDNNNNFRR